MGEFGLVKVKDLRTGRLVLKAKGVSLPGGERITLQDDTDAEKKEWVGSQTSRYQGTLKFYDGLKGFGYVKIKGKMPAPDVPAELRVDKSEVNAGGRLAWTMKDVEVEFGIV